MVRWHFCMLFKNSLLSYCLFGIYYIKYVTTILHWGLRKQPFFFLNSRHAEACHCRRTKLGGVLTWCALKNLYFSKWKLPIGQAGAQLITAAFQASGAWIRYNMLLTPSYNIAFVMLSLLSSFEFHLRPRHLKSVSHYIPKLLWHYVTTNTLQWSS